MCMFLRARVRAHAGAYCAARRLHLSVEDACARKVVHFVPVLVRRVNPNVLRRKRSAQARARTRACACACVCVCVFLCVRMRVCVGGCVRARGSSVEWTVQPRAPNILRRHRSMRTRRRAHDKRARRCATVRAASRSENNTRSKGHDVTTGHVTKGHDVANGHE